jgi:hypothetical protein
MPCLTCTFDCFTYAGFFKFILGFIFNYLIVLIVMLKFNLWLVIIVKVVSL